ncbi:MAG: ABC transporter permease [Gemmatimonadetes bacterium]|nr:ABC transporter permease [Gemmatimonadota bacterium]
MTEPHSPPQIGRFLLSLFVPREHHDTVIGDLDEEYRKHGNTRMWYWRECVSLSRAFLAGRIRDARGKPGNARWKRHDVSGKGRKLEMGVLLKDLRFGFRSLAKRPASALISVFVLSIGIGLSAFMFSIVYGVWLRGLDLPEADRLTLVQETNVSRDITSRRVPVHDLYDWRDQQRSFEGLFGWYRGTVNVSGTGGDPERFSGSFVTANMFDVLRVQPMFGRAFQEGEDQPGAPYSVILGYDMWRTRYDSSMTVLGQIIKVNGEQATVIGVMGKGFIFPGTVSLWLPMRATPTTVDRGQRRLSVMGRLNDGVTLEQAELELASIAEGLALQYPETNEGIGIRFISWVMNSTPLSFGVVFIVMMVSVVFVLLVACANVANLLLARATLRVKEAAVRTALGGTRLRVVFPFFAEAILLAVGAAVVGSAIAYGAISTFDSVTSIFRPQWIEFALDLPALLFISGTAVVVSVAAGALPAYQIAKTDVNAILKDEARGSSSFYLGKVSRALVVGEVALSCALLVGSGLMAKSMVNVISVEPRFDAEGVFTARVGLFPTVYPDAEARDRFFRDLQSRLQAHPQTAHAALTSHMPGGGGSNVALAFEGEEYQTDQDLPDVDRIIVSPGFFEALDVALLQGRDFTVDDDANRPDVAIVNQSFATRHFPEASPMGRRFREGNTSDDPWITIVGLSPDIAIQLGGFQGDSAEYYRPLAQVDQSFMTILATPMGGDPMALTTEIRGVVRALDDDLPIYSVERLSTNIEQIGQFFSIFGTLFILFGVVTLTIAGVGLYGVLSFSVSRRIKEMGVRIALGASGGHVIKMVLREGAWQIAVGMAIGLAGAWGVSNVLGNFLVNVEPRDPVVFGGVALLVVGIGLFGTWLPARKASTINPMVALRSE